MTHSSWNFYLPLYPCKLIYIKHSLLLQTPPQNSLLAACFPSLFSAPVLSAPCFLPNHIKNKNTKNLNTPIKKWHRSKSYFENSVEKLPLCPYRQNPSQRSYYFPSQQSEMSILHKLRTKAYL